MMGARIVRLAGIAIATFAAAWTTWAFTLGMVLARTDSDRSLQVWTVDAALSGKATRLLAGTPTRARSIAAGTLAEKALLRTPVDAEAVRNVAMGRLAAGDYKSARAIIHLGENLSRRDVPTQMWLIEDRVQAGDIITALSHYDRALRTSPESRPVLLPILAQAANDPSIARALAARLTVRPEWWSDFLGRFIMVATSPEAIGDIIAGLRLDPGVDMDRNRLITMWMRLVDIGRYTDARRLYDRVNHGATARSLVVDGGFEHDRGMPPFDWQLIDEADRSAVRERRDGASGNVALTIGGAGGGEVARQLLVLTPGRYRLNARVGAVSPEMTAPPILSVTCAQSGASVIAIDFPTRRGPGRIAGEFTVSPGCQVQWLSISSASDAGYLGDNPWIDDIALTPVATRRD